jgi:hypothetical protein
MFRLRDSIDMVFVLLVFGTGSTGIDRVLIVEGTEEQ